MHYEEVERHFGGAVRRIAASYAPPGWERDDLEQEIALAIFEALPEFRDESAIKTYVYRIAQNCCIDRLRRRAKNAEVLRSVALTKKPPSPQHQTPEQRVLRDEKYERLASAIRALPLKLRQPMVLRLEGLSYDEIGDVLELTTTNVGVRIHRATLALSTLIEESS